MKKQLFSTLTLVLALAAGMTACSSDDNFVGNNKDLVSNHKTVITVSDAHGFKASDGTPQTGNMTRALPAEYQENEAIERGTIFEEGDCIGVYVVDDQTHQIEQANVPYHYLGQMWDSDSGIAFSASGKSYYAYFPYQENPAGAPTAGTSFSGSDAAVFFNSLISGWTVQADQSTQANYVASDLMVGKATVTDNDGTTEVAFQMDHQMGLVVLNLGQIKHVLRSGNYYWFDEVNKKCKTTDGCYKPWYIHDEWRAIVPVGTAKTFSAIDDEWTVNAKVTEKGKFQVYKIGYDPNVANSGVKYFELQEGDIYYSDGSLMHVIPNDNDNHQARMARSADALGFVVFVSDGSGADQKVVDPSLNSSGMLACTYSHALVMSIKVNNNMPGTYNWNSFFSSSSEYIGYATNLYKQAGNVPKVYNSVQSAINDFNGSVSSSQVLSANAGNYNSWYNNNHPGPSGTNVPNSGWFIPGLGQIVHSLLRTGAITQSTYNDMAASTAKELTITIDNNIWNQYMNNATGANGLAGYNTFADSGAGAALITSTYYPNTQSGNVTCNWCIEFADSSSDVFCTYHASNRRPKYTCMMLAF